MAPSTADDPNADRTDRTARDAGVASAIRALDAPAPAGWPAGWRLAALDTVGSTQDVARALLSDDFGRAPPRFGADLTARPVGTAVTARVQTGGRGRQARGWHSPEGNLYLSLLLRPDIPLTRGPELGFVAALAVADTVSAMAHGAEVRLKWPNDVLLNGGKVAGILAETVSVPDTPTDRVGGIVIGMGLNLAEAPRPADLPHGYPAVPPIAVADAVGGPVDRDKARDHLMRVFYRLLRRWQRSGFGAIRRNVESQLTGWREPITVTVGETQETGRLLGLAETGALRLQRADGSERQIVAGDVTVGPRSARLGPSHASGSTGTTDGGGR